MEFNPVDEEWTQVGTMQEKRSDHGLSIVAWEDLDHLVAFVEENSTILTNKNQTRCHRYEKAAFLITGGDNGGGSGGNLHSMEIYNPMTDSGCSLPNLPESRYRHTQSENLLCGGWDGSGRVSICWTRDSKSGAWTQSHSLNTGRFDHVAWPTPSGVYLLGGLTDDDGITDTVELVTENTGVLDATFKYEV